MPRHFAQRAGAIGIEMDPPALAVDGLGMSEDGGLQQREIRPLFWIAHRRIFQNVDRGPARLVCEGLPRVVIGQIEYLRVVAK